MARTRNHLPKALRGDSTMHPKRGHVPPAARREMYEAFREHWQEVRDMLIGIVRDDEADNGHRIQAGKEILNRGFGQAPSIEIIEAAFKHELSISPDALRQLPPKQLAQFEAILATLVQVADQDTIDAVPVETGNESG
jgi:hypothetical protein